MSDYVLGFLFDTELSNVVLIRKNRPPWQFGLLNGVGGKVEQGESPEEAMFREFKEETGLSHHRWLKTSSLESINGSFYVSVFCFFGS